MAETSTLSGDHAEFILAQGINPRWASKQGLFSVSTEEDLPRDLSKMGFAVPGIVFPLRHLDGKVTHQIRPDNPGFDEEGNPRAKYLQPSGSGTIITVPKSMSKRVKSATTLMIVEGTKQTLAAANALEKDKTVLVVGIQGCSGWRKDQFIHPDLVSLVSNFAIDNVEIFFDKDVATNVDVWSAASELKDVLLFRTSLAEKNIKFISIEGLMSGATSGLDDLLGRIPESERPEAMERLRKNATKLPRQPATRKLSASASDLEWEVRMDTGEIVSIKHFVNAGGDDDMTIKREFGAAARIVEARRLVDEESGRVVDTNLVLDVAFPVPEGGIFTVAGHQVNDADLADFGKWLGTVDNPLALTVERDSRPQPEISNAIRSFSKDMEVIRELPRFGWYLNGEEWVFLSPGASIGPDGLVTSVVARPSQTNLQNISPILGNEDGVREAVRAMLEMKDLLNKPIQWIVGIACLSLAALPITPLAAVGYFGQRSSGKSTIAQGITSAISPKWAPPGPPMFTFSATAAAMDIMASGLRNTVMHVDDLKPEASRRKTEEVIEALDAMLRRSYGSPGKARGTVNKASGEVGLQRIDDANPLLLVTGEKVPVGGELADSGLDRLVVIQTEPGKTFKPILVDGVPDGGSWSLKRFEEICKSGELNTAYTAYRQHLAKAISEVKEERDGVLFEVEPERKLAVFASQGNESRSQREREINESYKEILDQGRVSSRARTAIASLLVGLRTFLVFASKVGAISEEEIGPIVSKTMEDLSYLVARNTDIYLGGNDSDAEDMLDRIRDLVASNVATLDEDESEHRRLIGKYFTKEVDGQPQEVVELMHGTIANLLRLSSGREVTSALKDVAIPDSKGNSTQMARINGERVRVAVIPMSVWDPERFAEHLAAKEAEGSAQARVLPFPSTPPEMSASKSGTGQVGG